MKGSGVSRERTPPLPARQLSKRQLQRKYYIMRYGFFQGLTNFERMTIIWIR